MVTACAAGSHPPPPTRVTPATTARVRLAVRAPDAVRCDALSAEIAAAERLSHAAASVVARSLALHHGAVVRWADGRPPVRVWVDRPAEVPSPDALTRAAREAVVDWNRVARWPRMRLVSDPSEADVIVAWATRIEPRLDAPSAHPTGRSGVVRDRVSGAIESARITLGTIAPDGRPLSARDAHAVALHEVGHVLGLAHPIGATTRGDRRRAGAASIMASDVAPDELTSADRGALRVWYVLPLGPLCISDPTPPPGSRTEGSA